MNPSPDMAQLLAATLCGAGVVLAGALYALLFTFAQLRSSWLLGTLAALAYALLAAATTGLAYALDLSGSWRIVTAVMLLGYLLGPWAIWQLCRGTHHSGHIPAPAERGTSTQEAQA